MANNTTGNPGLMFDIKIAGIDDKEVKKMYKEKEANIQKILDSSSTLSLSIKGVDIKDLNDQLSKTKKILDQITQANNKSIIGTPLQRAKADVAYMESAEKLRLKQALATTTMASAQDRAAKSTVQLRIEEERLAQAKLRTEAAQKKQLASTQKQTAAWTANKSAMNGIPQLLSSYASILGGVRLFTQIKDITREFELQRVALRAITQDVEFADQLFERIKVSALESPFSTKDLITYTKQLSAYRIENENLFGTMNQLADISAGLGVSMDRLILAYGQVKAASVLRGQELRQFTESGIPLVQMLAEKFTQLRGELVSTADVFELISERAVPFEMVAELFDDMTSAGGKFYEMQKIQAESLYGVYENLRDNIEIAFNELGENNRGALMALGKGATEVVQNLTKILDVLTAIGVGFAAYKIAVALAATSTNTLTIAQLRQVAATKAQMLATASNNKMLSVSAAGTKLFTLSQVKLATATNVVTKSFWKLTAALAKNPIGLVIVGVSALIGGLIAVTKESREAKKAYEEMAEGFSEKTMSVEKYTAKLRGLNKIEGDNTNVAERRAKIIEQLAEVDSDYAATIKDKTEDTDFLNEAEKRYVDTLRLKLALEKELLGLGTGKIIAEHADARERENRALSELNNNYAKNRANAKDMLNTAEISANTSKVLEEFIYGTGEYEDRLRALRLSLIGLRESGDIGFGPLQDILKSFDFSALGDWAQAAYDAKKATDELSASYASMIEETKGNKVIVDAMKSIDDAIANLGANPSDEAINQATWNLKNDIIRVYKDVFDSKGLSEELQAGFAGMFKEMTGFDFEIIAEPTSALDGWKKAFKDIGGYSEIEIENLGTYSDALDDIVKKYKENAEAIEKIKPSLDAEDPIVQKETQDKLDVYNEKQKEIYDTLEALNQLRLLSDKTAVKDQTAALNTELSVLNETYKKYQELRKFMSDFATKQKMAAMGYAEIDEDIYINALEALKRKYAALGEEEKSIEIGITIKDIAFDEFIENLEKQLQSITTAAEKQTAAQKLFEEVLGLSGDMEYATKVTLEVTGVEIRGKAVKSALQETLMNALTEISADGVSVKVPTELLVNGEFDIKKTLDFIETLPEKQKEMAAGIFKTYQQFLENSVTSLLEFYDKVDQLSKGDFNLFGTGTTFDISKIASDAITEYQNIEKARLEMITELDKASGALSDAEYQKELDNINTLYDKQREYQKKIYQEKLSDLAASIVTESINGAGLDMMLEDLGDKTLRQVRRARKELEDLSGYEILRISPETMALLEEQGVIITELKDANIEDIFGAVGENIPETEKMVLRLLQQVQNGELSLADLQAKITELFGEKIKNLTEEEFKKLTNSINNTIDSISEITGLISDFADEVGDTGLKSRVESFAGSVELLGSVFKGIASGGWIGAVIAIVTWFVKNVVSSFLDVRAQTEKLEQATYQYNEELRKAVINSKLLGEEYDTIFGENAWGKLTSDLSAYSDAIKAYNSLVTETSMDPEFIKKAFEGFTDEEMFDPKFIGTYIEGIKKGLNSIEAMAVKTKDYNWFAESFLAKRDEYTSLSDLAPDLFNEDGSVNTDALETLLSEYDSVLTQGQKNLLNELLTNAQLYEQAQEEVFEYLETLFGDTASTISESMVSAFIDSGNAAIDFGNIMSDVAEKMAQDIVTSLVFDEALAGYQELIKDIMSDTNLNAKEKVTQALALFKAAMGDVENMTPEIQAFLESVSGYFTAGETNLTGISKDIAGITEQSALALGAVGNNLVYQMVGVRGDVAAIRAIMEGTGGMGSGITLAQLQAMNAQNVAYLMDIRQNTADTAAACRDLAGSIRSVTSSRGTGSVKVLNTQLV